MGLRDRVASSSLLKRPATRQQTVAEDMRKAQEQFRAIESVGEENSYNSTLPKMVILEIQSVRMKYYTLVNLNSDSGNLPITLNTA